ncbi:MAG: hypothetical protein ACRCST_09405 [Turicibacter sp.]
MSFLGRVNALPKVVMRTQLIFICAIIIEVIELIFIAGMFTAPLAALISITTGLVAASIAFVYNKSYYSILNLIIVCFIYILIFGVLPTN